MARLSIGRTWTRLTPEQKQRAVQAYGRYITAIYATRFDEYAGEQFQVLGEQQMKHGTLVKTHIIKSNGGPVSIITCSASWRRGGRSSQRSWVAAASMG